MGFISAIVLVGSLAYAYIHRSSGYALGLCFVFAGYAFTSILGRLAIFERTFLWPTILSGTIYRYKTIRVSIAYLIAIPVDDKQLLIRGQRITTQYQPIGGVFKTRLTQAELSRRFKAKPDTRFTPDERSAQDLRLRLPGSNLYRLLRWFRSRQDRELFPTREFYEELIASGILDGAHFSYFDCAYIGTKHLPMKYDRYSQCQQLIVAEVYELRPSDQQLEALRDLKKKWDLNPSEAIYFASREEIDIGGVVNRPRAEFEIAPTAIWLVGK